MNRPATLGSTFLILACVCLADTPPADWTVSLRGAGPIRLGMSLDQVRRVLGDAGARLAGNEPDVPLTECAYLESTRLPPSLNLMFEDGHLVRIDVHDYQIKTSAGARIGDSEASIKKLYPGRITVQPHAYEDGGHYLQYLPPGKAAPKWGIVFETDGQRVTSFRIGTLDAIALVEGCS